MTETSVTDTPFYNDCIVLLKRCRKGCAALDGEDDSLAIVILFFFCNIFHTTEHTPESREHLLGFRSKGNCIFV